MAQGICSLGSVWHGSSKAQLAVCTQDSHRLSCACSPWYAEQPVSFSGRMVMSSLRCGTDRHGPGTGCSAGCLVDAIPGGSLTVALLGCCSHHPDPGPI